jgi:predicted nucleotidyltransferase
MDNKELITKITEKIKRYYDPQEIILFGSYSNGRQERDSDLDILIIKETNEKYRERTLKVRRILSEENSVIGMDIIVYTPEEISKRMEIGDSFLSNILNEGIVLYG